MARNEVAVIDNGKVYTFNHGGRCTGEDVGNITGYMSGALDLPVISVLASNGKVDIGVSDGHDTFKRYTTDLDAMSCALGVQSKGGFLRMLRRDGKQNNIAYNQLIFIYKEGTDLSIYLTALNAQEVK
jgi:hypothetical protein